MCCSINFFEDAQSAAAPGDHIAGSGMSVVVKVVNDKPIMRLTVKSYDSATPLYVGYVYADILLPANTDLQEFHKININDDGSSKIEIYFDDQKMATVTMSDLGVYAEDIADTEIEFYKTVKINDASDNEILSLDNSRLCKTSRPAFTSRNIVTTQGISYELDDVVLELHYPDGVPTPTPSVVTDTPVKTSTPTSTAVITATPDLTEKTTKFNTDSILIITLAAVAVLSVVGIVIFSAK